jgi:hypothetical protein
LINRYNCDPPPTLLLTDMTEEHIKRIEREYGCPVIRPR